MVCVSVILGMAPSHVYVTVVTSYQVVITVYVLVSVNDNMENNEFCQITFVFKYCGIGHLK